QTFSDRRQQLADLITALARTAHVLASQDAALAGTIHQTDLFLRETPAALVAINAAIPPVEHLSHELRPSLEIAPPVLAAANARPVHLAATVPPRGLPLLLTRLRPVLDVLPPVATKLTNVLPKLKPVVDCLRFHALPLLRSKVPDGTLSTGRPVWQD